MKVLETFNVKGRGCVAITKLDDKKMMIGTVLRRVSDGLEVRVRGIECHAILRAPRSGDTVGLLVSQPVATGDELEHTS